MISKFVLRLFGSKFGASWRKGRDQGFWGQKGKSKTNLLRFFCSQERQILEALQQRLETRKPGHWQKRLRCGRIRRVDAGYMVIPLRLHPGKHPRIEKVYVFFVVSPTSTKVWSLVNRNASSSHGSPSWENTSDAFWDAAQGAYWNVLMHQVLHRPCFWVTRLGLVDLDKVRWCTFCGGR